MFSVDCFCLQTSGVALSGRKRVRTFGMMKYLSAHMSSPNSAGKRH